ncbi:hypothetical protein [Atopococcus tabaci]|uniref:hypothetical protein n=1 Tax=Atopococcus tabaci TaxID=269774 RepID=UPI00040E1383|nr:hypothetical protein [Atopococcus tabaci]
MGTTLMANWDAQFTKKQPLLNHILLFLISFSFMLSDWVYGAFTFTELALGMIMGILLVFGKYKIPIAQWKCVAVPIGMISAHSLYHFLVNQEFDSRTALIAIIKLSFYVLVVAGIYNFIKVQRLESTFIRWNNAAALVVCVLGVYIAFAVYADMHLGLTLPYEQLLQFTRLDGHLYRRDIPIVRMKSIFEEPAHLGYYLNAVLMVNVLNKTQYKPNYAVVAVLIVSILFTLSYSAVFIMLATVLLWAIKSLKISKEKVKWNKKTILIILGVLLVLFLSWDFIYITLIQRTLELISGTESSGYERLVISWRYINKENYLMGLGFMQTPGMLWNIYAYVFTELGLIYFICYILGIAYLIVVNPPLGIVFGLMNFAKGGYLSSGFWFLILLVLIYAADTYKNPLDCIRKERQS